MERTCAIIDFAHSGTTMLAGMLEIFGVPMVNERYQEWKLEDWEVIDAIKAGDDAFATIVAERNERCGTWGFKWPGVWKFEPMISDHLRNPVYLAIYKDVVSVTRRRFGKSGRCWLKKVRNTARQIRKSVDGICATGLPVHTLSYHYAIIKPEKFVQQLVDATGLDVDQETFNKAVQYIQPNTQGPKRKYPKVDPWI